MGEEEEHPPNRKENTTNIETIEATVADIFIVAGTPVNG